MRFKFYLRGAGIGIILTTIIFTISIAASKDNTSYMSDSEFAKRAEEMGYVLVEKDSEVTGEEEEGITEENAAGKLEEDKDNKNNIIEESSKTDTADESEGDEAEKTEKPDEVAVKPAKDEVISYVSFTISPGQSSNIVAQNLYEAGIVDSAKKFSDYMDSLGVDNKIQSGSFYVTMNMDYEDIVAILVTKQDQRENTTLPEPNN